MAFFAAIGIVVCLLVFMLGLAVIGAALFGRY